MRVFIFRVEIQEGSDEWWDELEEKPLTEVVEEVRKVVEDILLENGLIHCTVGVVGARNDA